MLKKFTSKHLKIQLTSLRNAQSGEQLEQDEYHSTPNIDSSNGASQSGVPLTPWIDRQSGEQLEQDEYHSTPGLDGSPEYKVTRRSQIDRQPGEQVHQNDYYSAPDTYPPTGTGSQQFRVPST